MEEFQCKQQWKIHLGEQFNTQYEVFINHCESLKYFNGFPVNNSLKGIIQNLSEQSNTLKGLKKT